MGQEIKWENASRGVKLDLRFSSQVSVQVLGLETDGQIVDCVWRTSWRSHSTSAASLDISSAGVFVSEH